MKYYRYISAVLCAAVSISTAGTALAATENLGFRRPVNTITVSGSPGKIEYSNAGAEWTEVPYIQIGDTCYFDTVDARLFRFSTDAALTGSGFYTESAAMTGGFEDEYKRLDAALFAAGKEEARARLEKEMLAYLELDKDKSISRYNILCRRQELEGYMDNIKNTELDFEGQLAAAVSSVSKSIAAGYAHSQEADNNARSIYQKMELPASAGDSMWDNISMTKTEGGKKVLDSAALTSVYKNIYAMAMAYQCPDSAYYKNASMLEKIKTALEYADKYYYSKDTVMYGNWWDFLIGVPSRYCKILSVVWNDLSADERARYAEALRHFCDYRAYSGAAVKPGEYQAGANLVNIANYDYIMGVLTGDEEKINNAAEKFYSAFEYNPELFGADFDTGYSDGFYSDGSFLQHGVPYNGSYGREFFAGVIDMAESLAGTRWGFSQKHYQRVNEWIDDGFMPFIFRGGVMDAVSGRAASRNNTEKKYGYQIARSILHYADMLRDEDKKREYIETVKYWFESSSPENGITWETDCDDFSKRIVNDPKYAAADHTETGRVYTFPNMDRAVYRPNDDWAVGISMYSSRTPSYEVTNGENTKGWYTGSGAVYLCNSDDTHYAKNYWLAADMYCIPGTTVDSTTRYFDGSASSDSTNPHYQNGDAEGKSKRDFVGSMAFEGGGAAAMQLAQGELPLMKGMTYSDLSANKSYFMLPDGVLCMGTAISGGNGEKYTCVENRAVDENSFDLYVNGAAADGNMSTDAPETVSISGSCGNISYYFPMGGELELNTGQRSVSAQEVNVNNRGTVSGSFFTMKLRHGADIRSSSYCYMLLPDRTAAEAEAFAKNPNMKIIRMSEDIHAVSYKDGDKTITAAVFFAPGEVTTETGGSIGCDSQAIVMLDSDGNIAVTDITRKLSEINVTVDGGNAVKFDTSAAFGKNVCGVM